MFKFKCACSQNYDVSVIKHNLSRDAMDFSSTRSSIWPFLVNTWLLQNFCLDLADVSTDAVHVSCAQLKVMKLVLA